jgi:hypothetical protein
MGVDLWMWIVFAALVAGLARFSLSSLPSNGRLCF